MSIPASTLVSVLPGVVSAGGSSLSLTGMVLSANTAVPIGTVKPFANAAAVAAFFGGASSEANIAAVYFAGFDNSTVKPAQLLFTQYPSAPVAGYLRSASLAAMTLAQLNAVTAGVMTVTVDGVLKTSTSINLSTATSFSNAATIMTAAFTGVAVTYDTQRAAFVITSGTTGASSLVTYAGGAIAIALSLTQATGAVTSAGAIAATPAAFMPALTSISSAWATFMTVFEPLLADKTAFGTWTSQQNSRFVYCCWDTDANAIVSGNTTCFGAVVGSSSLGGCLPVTSDPGVAASLGVTQTSITLPLAALAMGYFASLNFAATNGRQTLAYRSQGGIVAGVQDPTIAAILIANNYDFYGNYATSQPAFTFMQPGSIGGAFKWADSYANEIWMNSNFQQALLNLLIAGGSIPYSPFGYSAIESSLQDPINAAINYGAIRQGVVLSGSQIAAVNASAGANVASVLQTRGWYLSVRDPGPTVRAARGTPVMTFYYTDGGAVQTMQLASLNLQ